MFNTRGIPFSEQLLNLDIILNAEFLFSAIFIVFIFYKKVCRYIMDEKKIHKMQQHHDSAIYGIFIDPIISIIPACVY